MPTDNVSWLAFSCTHSPLHDQDAVDWALGIAEDRQPDVVIHLGDFLEADAASRWPSEYDWTLADEFREADKILSDFRKVTPKSKHVLTPGNHDFNVLAINRIDKKLRGLVDWRDHELLPEIRDGRWEVPCRYEYSRHSGVYRIGQVTFSHGYKAGETADKLQCERLCKPYGLLVSGHTHRPKQVAMYQPALSRAAPYWAPSYANAGALRNIEECEYMERKDRAGWGQAVVVGESQTWRYDSSYAPEYRAWEAETILYKLYDDE